MKRLPEELYKMVTLHENAISGCKVVLDKEGVSSIPRAISTKNQLLYLPWGCEGLKILWVNLLLASKFELGWEEEK